MGSVRFAAAGAAVAMALAATPAAAQFYLKSKDIAGHPVSGSEPGMGQPLPGATAAEEQAALVWNMRAALNVAALQCQFEPTLVTVENYNAILTDHKAELKASFDTLTKYFVRVAKSPKAGQSALDQFGTRTYAGFAPVAAQLNFCQAANRIGSDAVFQPRGQFHAIAKQRMREMRNSLAPSGEQMWVYSASPQPPLPRLDSVCWSKKGEWVVKKCGDPAWPPAGVDVAQR